MKAKSVLLVFVVLGLLIIGTTIYYAATIERAARDVVAVTAPDGKYKAVRLRIYSEKQMSFCVDTIAIYLALYPDSFAASKRTYEVYSGSCPEASKRSELPKIEWTDHKSVRITYAPAGDKPPRLRDQDASRFVGITWVKAE